MSLRPLLPPTSTVRPCSLPSPSRSRAHLVLFSLAATKEQEAAAKLDALARKAAQVSAQEEKDRKDRERRALEQRERDLEERERKLKEKAVRKPVLAPTKSKDLKPTGPKRPPFNFEKVSTHRAEDVGEQSARN